MISRRDFARTAGAAIAGAALLPRATAAADEATRALTATAAAHPAKKLAAASQAEADARVQMVVARYGSRLEPDARAELTRMSRSQQALLDELRAFPLDYADEPALQFRAPRTHR
jgi:hypothetical protein